MRRLIILAALGALAACNNKEAKPQQGNSFGQVLPGSASDAMLPFDTATSSPPLAPPTYDTPQDAGTGAKAKPSSATDDEAAPEAVPT